MGLMSSQLLSERKAGGSEEMENGKQRCRATNRGMHAPLDEEKDKETDSPLEPTEGIVSWLSVDF